MESIRISDSYDLDMSLSSTLKKSLNNSIKPKFIAQIQETQKFSFQFQQNIKKTDSIQIFKSFPRNIKNINLIEKINNLDKQISIAQKIKKNLQQVKSSTVFEDKTVNLFLQFQKSEKLVMVKHSNKKALKFIKIHQYNQKNMLIQITEWNFFINFQGKAILILPDNRKIKGNWQNGVTCGQMLITYPNESIYYGPLNSELQKNGTGFIYFKNGCKLQGRFQNGKMIGRGIYYNKAGQIQKDFKYKNGLLMSSKRS